MIRRLLLLVPLLLATTAVLWRGLFLPPPLWLLKYGLAPGCEPKGEVTVEGVEFVVIGPGIARIGSAWRAEHKEMGFSDGDLLGRVATHVRLPWGEPPVPSNEMPVHYVEFPRGFAIATKEVTNAQYRPFLGEDPFEAYFAPKPSRWKDESLNGPRQPVAGVGFEDAQRYCEWLALRSGRNVRLPTEAEWECACRSGGLGEYAFGDDETALGEYAWIRANSGEGWPTHEVGTRKANAWGLHDLHGNVWEWCEDTWHASYVSTATLVSAPEDGSAWVSGNPASRVIRGGGVGFRVGYCRSAYRTTGGPGLHPAYIGIRLAMDVPEE